MTWHRLAAVLVSPLVVASLAIPAEGGSDTLTAAQRLKTVNLVGDRISENYFDRERAADISQVLRRNAADGAFDSITTKSDLAQALTGILEPFDRHFKVVWSADGATFDHHDVDWNAYARRTNFGFSKLEILPGNVGYLRLNFFNSPESAGKTLQSAMDFLAHVDAVILDVTHNGGGEPEMVQLLTSHFVGPKPVQTGEIYWRLEDKRQQYWTLPYVPGKRFLAQPLFVLTSAATGSAAEAFADFIKRSGRGTLVGQTTYGAGNPGRFVNVGGGFQLFVSYGGPVDSEQSFDGVGVSPSVETPAGKELSTALLLAWDQIEEVSTDESHVSAVERHRERLRAQLTPYALTEAQKRAAEGDYGDRQIAYRDGTLVYQRGRRSPQSLVAAGEHTFFLPSIRIDLVADASGVVRKMRMTWDDGHQEVFTKR